MKIKEVLTIAFCLGAMTFCTGLVIQSDNEYEKPTMYKIEIVYNNGKAETLQFIGMQGQQIKIESTRNVPAPHINLHRFHSDYIFNVSEVRILSKKLL